MKFNERLIKLRKAKGLSQEELGYELNVTRQTISKWELGESTPEMEKLIQISNFFGVSVDELISNNDNEASSKNYNKEFVGVDEKYIPNDVKNDASYVNNNKSSKKMMALPIVFIMIPFIAILVSIIIMVTRMASFHKSFNDSYDTIKNNSENIIENSVENFKDNNKEVINKIDNSVKSHEEEAEKIQNAIDEAQESFNQNKDENREELNKELQKMQDDYNKIKDEAINNMQNN